MKVVLGLIFLIGGFVPVANAYPIGGAGTPLPLPPVNASGSFFNFNFTNSFQNLIAPFESFFRSLEGSIGTTSVVGGEPSLSPIFIPTSTFQSEFQNGPQQFDDWFYNLTHIRVSDIALTIGRSILWIRGPVQQCWQWMLQQLKTGR